MKVNFNQTVKDFKGNSTDIVISDKLAELLFFAGNSDFRMTREEKWRAYKISQKLIAGDNRHGGRRCSHDQRGVCPMPCRRCIRANLRPDRKC